MWIFTVKILLRHWQLSMAWFRFCETYLLHIRPRSWSTRVRLVHSWAAPLSVNSVCQERVTVWSVNKQSQLENIEDTKWPGQYSERCCLWQQVPCMCLHFVQSHLHAYMWNIPGPWTLLSFVRRTQTEKLKQRESEVSSYVAVLSHPPDPSLSLCVSRARVFERERNSERGEKREREKARKARFLSLSLFPSLAVSFSLHLCFTCWLTFSLSLSRSLCLALSLSLALSIPLSVSLALLLSLARALSHTHARALCVAL